VSLSECIIERSLVTAARWIIRHRDAPNMDGSCVWVTRGSPALVKSSPRRELMSRLHQHGQRLCEVLLCSMRDHKRYYEEQHRELSSFYWFDGQQHPGASSLIGRERR